MMGLIGEGVAQNRAVIEISGRLRSAQHRLQADLDAMTAWGVTPPLDPAHDAGYIEIIEGPGPWIEVAGDTFALGSRPVRDDGTFDSSVRDVDDVLMFTARSYGEPFIGTWQGASVQSQVAEIAWFVRGDKLYRRQLLVLPNREPIVPPPANYYLGSCVSVRSEGGPTDPRAGWFDRQRQVTPNTLGDLTKRENRFAHQPMQFPHDATFWGQLGLPTMQETAHPAWRWPVYPGGGPNLPVHVTGWTDVAGGIPYVEQRDHWNAPLAGLPLAGEVLPNYAGDRRVMEDVILTGVIGFDVKVWDPVAPVFEQVVGQTTDADGNVVDVSEPVLGDDPLYKRKLKAGNVPISMGAYVDLYYTRGTGSTVDTPFAGPGHAKSRLAVTDEARQPAVYCTWSTHYENDGIDQDEVGGVDQGSNGIDDDGQNGVDDPGEAETMPPYPFKLLGLQVIILVKDDDGQIRQVTVRRSGSK